MGNKIKISESNLHDIIGNAITEALRFQRSLGQNSPKGNVGPKDSNLNFFVTIGSGANRRIIGDKGFKTREAAERKAESLRKQGKEGVSIIKKMVAESDASLGLEYPEKLIYYPKDGELSGDMGYDACDKGSLGDSPDNIANGIMDYFTNDYPSEKEEMYYDCVVVMCVGKNPEKLYISSLDGKFANAISDASVRMFGRKMPVEVVGGNSINESALRKIVAESVKKVLKEHAMNACR